VTFEDVIKSFSTRGLSPGDVQRYLDTGGDIDYKHPQRHWTLLHFAAEGGNPEVVRLLAARGASLNATDLNGHTPLHIAVDSDLDASCQLERQPSLPTAQALLSAGADEALKDADNLTARDYAVAYGQETLYDSLARKGA